MSERETGQVKWFNDKKGFGFIVNTHGDDIFVHYQDIVGDKDIPGGGFKTLREKDCVTYTRETGPKGLKARDVVVVNEAQN